MTKMAEGHDRRYADAYFISLPNGKAICLSPEDAENAEHGDFVYLPAKDNSASAGEGFLVRTLNDALAEAGDLSEVHTNASYRAAMERLCNAIRRGEDYNPSLSSSEKKAPSPVSKHFWRALRNSLRANNRYNSGICGVRGGFVLDSVYWFYAVFRVDHESKPALDPGAYEIMVANISEIKALGDFKKYCSLPVDTGRVDCLRMWRKFCEDEKYNGWNLKSFVGRFRSEKKSLWYAYWHDAFEGLLFDWDVSVCLRNFPDSTSRQAHMRLILGNTSLGFSSSSYTLIFYIENGLYHFYHPPYAGDVITDEQRAFPCTKDISYNEDALDSASAELTTNRGWSSADFARVVSEKMMNTMVRSVGDYFRATYFVNSYNVYAGDILMELIMNTLGSLEERVGSGHLSGFFSDDFAHGYVYRVDGGFAPKTPRSRKFRHLFLLKNKKLHDLRKMQRASPFNRQRILLNDQDSQD